MNSNHEAQQQADNMEKLKQEAASCGAGCGCHSKDSSSGIRRVIGVVVLLAAGVLVARAVVKDADAPAEKTEAGFASMLPVATAETAAPDEGEATALIVKEISALSELNNVAADTDAVFVFLPGKKADDKPIPAAEIESAIQKISKQTGMKISVFALRAESPDYAQVVTQVNAPSVLSMVKGRGMSATSGEITEAALFQAFVGASSAGGGCGPSSGGGCGPRGCR